MASAPQTQHQIVFGRHCLPWSPSEMTVLESLIRRPATKGELIEAFPDRSPSAVRRQLTRMRGAAGLLNVTVPRRIEDQRTTMLDPDTPALRTAEEEAWRRRCIVSNQRFLAAFAQAMAA